MFDFDQSFEQFQSFLDFVRIVRPLSDYDSRIRAEVEVQGRIEEFSSDGKEGAIDETKSSENRLFFIVGSV